MSGGDAIDPWQVYALCYGYTRDVPPGRTAIDDPDAQQRDIAYYVWALTCADHTVVVDTGFNAASGARRGHTLTRRPSDLLRALGTDPETVETVVLTHLHYDHAGNLPDYPAATLHVQAAELAFATGPLMGFDFFASMYEGDDVAAAVHALHERRLVAHDGDWDVAPGVTAHLSPGHTPGVQFLRVWTRRGWLILASDSCHYTFLRERQEVYPVVWDPAALLRGYQRLTELASAPDLVIPGHDPLVLRLHPAARPELSGQVVRLD